MWCLHNKGSTPLLLLSTLEKELRIFYLMRYQCFWRFHYGVFRWCPQWRGPYQSISFRDVPSFKVLAGYTIAVARHFLDKIRSHTCTMDRRVVGMESFPSVANIRRKFKPQGRSRGRVNSTRMLTTDRGDLNTGTWRAVKDLQRIITAYGVKRIEHHFDAVATGYRNTPGASLVVWIIVGVLRTCKASEETSTLRQGTSCKQMYIWSCTECNENRLR